MRVLIISLNSFDDEIDGAVNSNLVILAIGCSAIFIYIGAVLGKLNWVEQRVRGLKHNPSLFELNVS